jgi:hypothetical protein
LRLPGLREMGSVQRPQSLCRVERRETTGNYLGTPLDLPIKLLKTHFIQSL